ncbi:MAG: hypothetical protein U9N73_06465 [Candidatus Auribacterota bacterium]|nr:hypothetical protein [Candidatus Auribacterota bacterium]
MKYKIDHREHSGALLDRYYDQEMSLEEVREYESVPVRSRETTDDILREYSILSESLKEFARQELQRGEGISLWPEIRSQLEEEQRQRQKPATGKLTLLRRPAWLGLALSAAAALILFFSGVFQSDKLPANYCRIDSIAAPGHNFMILKDNDDGPTIIWIME